MDNNYYQLKNKLDETIKAVRQISDLRTAKAKLIEVQGMFKGISLPKEQREELYVKLQSEFEKLNKKIEDEKIQYENEAAQNYMVMKTMIEDAEYMVKHTQNPNESFSFLIEIQSKFKGIKLLREQREGLYSRLQSAFESVKQKQSDEKLRIQFSSENHFKHFFALLENYKQKAENNEIDNYEFKELLIKLQNDIRESELTREHREKLNIATRDVFTIIDIRKEEQQERIEYNALKNYEGILPLIKDILLKSENDGDTKNIREKLKNIQLQIKEMSLLKEQRNELYAMIQEAFEKLNEKMDAEKGYFLRDARENYSRIKQLVDKGLKQAETTHEYKDTREFLKKIQNEFKGVRMIKEEREELYSRLQQAFEILNSRVDDYYHNKKKNWTVRMQYKISECETEILNLQADIEKDNEILNELKDQLEIMESSNRSDMVITGLKARIVSVDAGIKRKQGNIINLEAEIAGLKSRLDTEIL